MKAFNTLILIFLFTSFFGFAQQGINYKALVKDNSGNVVANQTITVEFSILQGVAQTNVYLETHTTTTDANGIVIVNIGEGTTSDDFSIIDWSGSDHFLNVKIDTGSGLTDLGTTQFKSVPYALSAGNTTKRINELIDGHSDNDGTEDGSSIYLGLNAGTMDDFSDNKNIGVGFNALAAVTTGGANVAVGHSALLSNTTSNYNVAVGTRTLTATTTFGQNVAVGYEALRDNTSERNTSIGAFSMSKNTTGEKNVAIGYGSLFYNISGNSNVGIGISTLLNTTTTNDNTAIGSFALIDNVGASNTVIGYSALGGNTTGNDNVGLGKFAGLHNNGSGNIFIGRNAGSLETNLDNTLIIANTDTATPLIKGDFNLAELTINGNLFVNEGGARKFEINNFGTAVFGGETYWREDNTSTSSDVLGRFINIAGAGAFDIYDTANVRTVRVKGEGDSYFNSGGVGFGTDTPSATVDIEGTFQFKDGSEALGNILSSDATGNATWISPSTLSSVNADNGITAVGNTIKLGGTLTETTTIAQAANNMIFNMSGPGEFLIQDEGVDRFRVNDFGTAVFGGETYWREDNTSNSSDVLGRFINIAGAGAFDIYDTANVRTVRVKGEGDSYFNSGGVGFGTDTPSATVDIEGTFQFKDGSEALGNILSSDATGNATWISPSTLSSVNADNGITAVGNTIKLGGTLTETTTIAQAANNMVFNMSGTGEFIIQDEGMDHFKMNNIGTAVFGGETYWREDNTSNSSDILGRFINFAGAGAFDIYGLANVRTIRLRGDGDSYFNSGGVGFGTDTPSATVDIEGTLQFKDGSEALGNILSSDATGNATWISPNSLFSVTADNGITAINNAIKLGGTLTETTTIAQAANNMIYNMSGTGEFIIQDEGVNRFKMNNLGTAVFGGETYWREDNTDISSDLLGRFINFAGAGAFDIYGLANVRTIRLRGDGDSYFNSGGVGFGTETPSATVDIEGTFQYKDGNEASGKILSSDATGNASWIVPNSLSLVTASNGITASANDVKLGGILTEATTITQDANNMIFNLSGTGEFIIQDAGVDHFKMKNTGDAIFSGKVGIGNDLPNGFLEIKAANSSGQPNLNLVHEGTTGARINFSNTETTNGNRWTLYGDTNDTDANSFFNLYHPNAPSGGNILQIRGDGRVGVNGSPTTEFQVYHGADPSTDGFKLSNTDSNTNFWRMHVNNGNGRLTLYSKAQGSTSVGDFSAVTGTYSATSDRRLKKDFQPLPFTWENFMKLETLSYLYKSQNDNKRSLGLIAQDVEAIYPELINYNKEDDVYLMNYTGFGVIAIKAIQEQQKIIMSQQSRIDALEAKLDEKDNAYNALTNRIETIEALLNNSKI